MCCLGEVLRLGRISSHTVNGAWSSWSSWSQCSRDCSRGIRSRKRTCSNPEPRYGGQTCLGPAQEYQECNITPCPGKKSTNIFCTVKYMRGFQLISFMVTKASIDLKKEKRLSVTHLNTHSSTRYSGFGFFVVVGFFVWLMYKKCRDKITDQIIRNHKRNQLQIRGVTKTPIYAKNQRDNPCGAPLCNYIPG